MQEEFCGCTPRGLCQTPPRELFRLPAFSKVKLGRQVKGKKAYVAAFVNAVETCGPSPIPFEELIEVAEATIAADEALRS